MEPIHSMFCSCCGGWTRGRQWHNRDIGYGLCEDCHKRLTEERKMDPAEIERCYGVRGVHFGPFDGEESRPGTGGQQ